MLQEELVTTEIAGSKLAKDKEAMEKKNNELSCALVNEVLERQKLKVKLESRIAELEDCLRNENSAKLEMDCMKRKLVSETEEVKEDLKKKKQENEELKLRNRKLEEDLKAALVKVDLEATAKTAARKSLEELQTKIPQLNAEVVEYAGSLMEIFVKTLRGKTITLKVHPFEAIEDVRAKIAAKEGIPLSSLRLIHCGVKLEDNRTCFHYNIQNDSTIHILFRICGGSISTSSRK